MFEFARLNGMDIETSAAPEFLFSTGQIFCRQNVFFILTLFER